MKSEISSSLPDSSSEEIICTTDRGCRGCAEAAENLASCLYDQRTPQMGSMRLSPRVVPWLLFLAFLPALILLWGILKYGLDMPLMDQWMPDMAGMFIRLNQGSFGL